MKESIESFCDRYAACDSGRAWALETGEPDMASLWVRKDMLPIWRIWIVCQRGLVPEKELQAFSCWCVRQVWHLLPDPRSRAAIEAMECMIAGTGTWSEVARTSSAALSVLWLSRDVTTARARAEDAAAYVNHPVLWVSVSGVSREVANALAMEQIGKLTFPEASTMEELEEASVSTGNAKRKVFKAVREVQAEYLLANVHPNFQEKA